ncbi:MAG TPA: PIN domain-containing protein [Verrucomicrobiae bacterium]|nr:PIN domain-containing protein [Verrucomicrobiae bacterium]
MKAVVDTRFLINSLAAGDKDFQNWSRQIFQTLQGKENMGVIPSIVVHEFYKFLLETLGKDVAELRVSSLLKLDFEKVNLDIPIAIQAAKLRCKFVELPTADAVIAATGIILGCDCVLTDDRHIRQVREVKTRWI